MGGGGCIVHQARLHESTVMKLQKFQHAQGSVAVGFGTFCASMYDPIPLVCTMSFFQFLQWLTVGMWRIALPLLTVP